jgi:Ca2+-binding RTX toxin-like protein
VIGPAFSVPSGWTLKGTADFNNDGEIDVVVTNGSANQIWLIRDAAVLSTSDLPFWSAWSMRGIADLDGDGDKDILYQSGSTQYAVYLTGMARQGAGYVNGKSADAIQPLTGSNQGTDTVEASLTYTLGNGVENLTLVNGAGNIDGTGNGAANVIAGNDGNNTLTGLAGADTFVFKPGFGHDTIADYSVGQDNVNVDHTMFADFAALIAHAADDGLGNTVITADANNSITLTGVTKAVLAQHQSDWHFT